MMLINGKPADTIPATDRGLMYGDGLFSTFAVVEGKVLCWDAHWRRLMESCQRLGLPAPNAEILLAEIASLCGGETRCVVKCILTRGSGGRGYRPPQPTQPTRLVSRHPWPDYPAENSQHGVQIRICETHLGRNPALAGIKHLNRLEQVLARGEWDSPDIAEGLMLDSDGYVIEGTMSNVFFVRDGSLNTPDLSFAGVAGVMRGQVLSIADSLQLPVNIGHYALDELRQANEIFLTNSLIGLWPVRQLETQNFAVGNITRQLQSALRDGHHAAF